MGKDLPGGWFMETREILNRCDHTLLRVDATSNEIRSLCDEGIRYHTASVCIPPCHLAGAKAYTGGAIPLCTVIGFPNGYSTATAKAFEAEDAVRKGADEVDMVINLAMVKDRAFASILEEIRQVREVCIGKVLKVIIETCLLTIEEKRILCDIVSESGADFIKTSTGFSKFGATREDVRFLREHVASNVQVKAAGGIKTLDDAADFIQLGASRLGTSRLVHLAIEAGYRPEESAPSF
jgi:deoxyribose-phosphate aldolase